MREAPAWIGGALLAAALVASGPAAAARYDLVIANGRVMDPESGLDAVRNVGIRDGRIAEISKRRLDGAETLDARGLVVAPGFIDLHAHGQDAHAAGLQARDGVTTQLEMEIGVYPVAAWYASREGRAPINFGATVAHEGVRIRLKHGIEMAYESSTERREHMPARPAAWADEAATAEEVDRLLAMLEEGLDEGALGIGFGLAYTPAARREEIWRCFALAARRQVPVFVHVRSSGHIEPGSTMEAMQEVIANAATTGASLQIVHIGSSGRDQVPAVLEMIKGAQRSDLDVTTEVYPWGAAHTAIGAAIFDGDWRARAGADYGDLEWVATGERLTAESFARYRREQPKGGVVAHIIPEDMVRLAVADPIVMIASDGGSFREGRAHPRGAGTFARVLGHYSRDLKLLPLMEALRKMTLMPAARLEAALPQMRNKGRIRVGADADLTIFDADRVIDRATYADPDQPSAGIVHVLVGGRFVVRDETLLEGVYAGQPVRRPARAAAARNR
jgi:dihydroorotase